VKPGAGEVPFSDPSPTTTDRRTNVASEHNSQTVSFEELAYSNMLTLNALVELLTEKGLLSKQEALERVKQLQAETQLRKRHSSCGNKVS
jgi:hypothetical protein